ncbi:MAG TPA: T9SS type A sorting domain-containing protein [bacterium]|jgi:hypothetical protein
MHAARIFCLVLVVSLLAYGQSAPDSLGLCYHSDTGIAQDLSVSFDDDDDSVPVVPSTPQDAGFLETTALYPNYPNPFNPETEVAFDLPQSMNVLVAVYDILGQHVMTLASGWLEGGHHVAEFDGSDLPPGIYFCRLDAPGVTQTHRMTLLK